MSGQASSAGWSKRDTASSPVNSFVVALDGDLLRTDLFGEILAANLRTPFAPVNDCIDVATLPYNETTLAALRAARQSGLRTVLKADPNNPTVQAIVVHFSLIDAIEAGAAPTLKSVPGFFQARPWLRALRLHQWVKNALIFMPLLASHQILNLEHLQHALVAFLAFGLCASSVYVLNDIIDLKDDRRHKFKKDRPFAAGALRISSGLLAVPALLVLSLGLSFVLLPLSFAIVLGVYYSLTLCYSLFLKRVMAIDVIVLAVLYTLRIFAGVAALALPLTFWMLAFAMFLFLSLALAKRYAELQDAMERGVPGKTLGRDYEGRDLEMISSLGAAAGYQAALVLALYVREQSTVALYARPDLLWLACPVLLFWITRVWMLTRRGQMHEDPVVFAANDRVSQMAGAMFMLVFFAAS